MPCRSGWEEFTPEMQKRWDKEKREREIKELQNTSEYLEIVLLLANKSIPSFVTKTKVNGDPRKRDADKIVSTLCKELKNASEELKEKITNHELGIFIRTWWSEHKKFDKLNNNG